MLIKPSIKKLLSQIKFEYTFLMENVFIANNNKDMLKLIDTKYILDKSPKTIL